MNYLKVAIKYFSAISLSILFVFHWSFADFSSQGITPPQIYKAATLNDNYIFDLDAVGGQEPLNWSITSGALPPGLTINSTNGVIEGTPTELGIYNFDINVQDSLNFTSSKNFTLSVYLSVGGFSYTRTPAGPTISDTLQVNIKGVFGADLCDTTSNTYGVLIRQNGDEYYAAIRFLNRNIGEAVDDTFNFLLPAASFQSVRLICTGPNAAYSEVILEAGNPLFSTFLIGPKFWKLPVVNQEYSLQLESSAGGTPFNWSIINGSLPSGLNLNSETGLISGIPQNEQSSNFTIQVEESNGATTSKSFSLTVYPSVGGFSYTRTPSGSTISDTLQVNIKGVFGADLCDASSNSYGVILRQNGDEIYAATRFLEHNLGENVDDVFNFTVPPGSYQSVRLLCVGQNNFTTFLESGTPIFSSFIISPTYFQMPVLGQTFSLDLEIAGSGEPYVWSINSGTLPSGLVLNSSTGVISGIPSSVGSSSFIVQVQNQLGEFTRRNYTLNVYPSVGGFSYTRTPSGPTISDTLQVNIKGVFGADLCDTSSVAYGVLIRRDGDQIFSSANSSFHAIGENVNDTFNFTLAPGNYQSVRLFCVGKYYIETYLENNTITGGITPIIISTNQNLTSGLVNSSYNQTIETSGGNGQINFSIILGSLPSGLNLNSVTGEISGVAFTAGTSTFTIKATDASGTETTKSFTIEMFNQLTQVPLSIITNSLPSGLIDTQYSSAVIATGGVQPLTWSIIKGTLSNGFNLNARTGIITGISNIKINENITILVTDFNGATTSAKLKLKITK